MFIEKNVKQEKNNMNIHSSFSTILTNKMLGGIRNRLRNRNVFYFRQQVKQDFIVRKDPRPNYSVYKDKSLADFVEIMT